MSLPLKIKIQKTDQTKVMKFAPNMSVAECIRSIQEKGIEGGTDHGLFQPAGQKNPARWLKLDRTLLYYDLQPNDEVEYKKRHRPLKIKLMDDTIKTILVDDTLTVGEIVGVIGEKMTITNSEEFSLKVDSKGEWLNSTQSLHEQGVGEDAVLLFQKKFYVTDATVSIEDPLALHLVYIQSRDSILAGHHPCTPEEAVSFGALQCQIMFGNYDPSKNRTLELPKLLPPAFHKVKKIEEKITKEHKKLVGMSEVNAKYRYVQLCRSLKTYGITFFACKQKVPGNQKKLKGINLGITRDSVIFMDEETQEIIKESPITHLRRWAAAPTTFTLDFGDHEKEYMVLQTNEGDAISSLLAGYIDILLKKQKSGAVVLRDDQDMIADTENVYTPVLSSALTSVTMSTIKGFSPGTQRQESYGTNAQMYSRMPGTYGGQAVPTNLSSAQSFVGSIIQDLNGNGQPFARNVNMSVQQWRNQLISNTNAVMSSVAKLQATLPPNMFDRAGMDGKAAEIASNLAQLISAARNAAFKNNGDDDVNLLKGAKMVADAIKDLLAASKDLSDHPTDAKAIERYNLAQKALQSATAYLQAANKGNLSDDSSQQLMLESARNVASCIEDLLNNARARNESNPTILGSADNTKRANEDLQATVTAVAPAILDATCQSQLHQVCKALETAVGSLCQTAKTSGDSTGMMLAAKDISDAIAQLLGASTIAEPESFMPDFTTIAKEMFDELAKLNGAQQNPGQINQSQKAITVLSSRIASAAREASSLVDDQTKDRLMNAVKAVASATQKLVGNAQAAAANPNDKNAHKQLQEACQRLAEATRALVGDAVEKAAMRNLRAAAKVAAAATTGLVTAAKMSLPTCSDPQSTESLKGNSKQASEAVSGLVKALQEAWKNPDDQAAQDALLKESHNSSPQAYKLVAAAKSALPFITDATNKNNLRQAASDAAEALQKLVDANKSVIISSGQATIDQALERFSAEESHLDSALLDVDSGSLVTDPNQTPDGAIQLLNIAAKQVAGAIKNMATTAKTNPDELGNVSLVVADAVTQVNTAAKVLASTIPDKAIQRAILKAARELTVQARNALTSARAVAANPSDPNLNGLLANSARNLAEALASLLSAAKGTQTGGRECDDAVAAIAVAVRNLEPKQGNVKDYPVYADELENSVKAIQSATLSLVSAAKNNPKALGSAAKSTALTIPPLVAIASQTAGASPNVETQKGIMSATVETANVVTNLINAAKASAGKNDPNAIEGLNSASSAVSAALDKLLAAINSTPAQKQFNDAIEEIMRAASRLSEPNNGVGDLSSAIEGIKSGTTKLGEATKGIIGASRTDPEQMGSHSRHAASAVTAIIAASVSMANASKVSGYSEDAGKVKDSAQQLVSACQSSDMATAKPQIIKAARDITLATQAFAENVKRDALTSSDSGVQNLLSNAAQNIAAATSALVNAAKATIANQPGSKEQLAQAQEELLSVIDDLLENDPNKAPSAKSRKLVSVAQQAASATSAMIELSKNVHKRPTDTDAISELSQSARAVGNAIKGLLDVSKSIGEIDLDEAISKISHAVSDLDSASISATVGLLENTAPPGKTTQVLEEDLVELAKKLASSIKTLTSEKDSAVSLAKAAKATAGTIPELATIAIQLASLASDPESQQSTLGLAKAIADSTLLLTNACKQNDMKEIVVQAKDASQAIVKMLSSLKGGVIALRDCDEAVKVVVESSKPLTSYQVNSPLDPSKSYADSQRELTNLAKELVGSIAVTVNAAKSKPHEVGEQAKKVAGLAPKFVNNTISALSSISEPDVRSGLLNSSKNVISAMEKVIKSCKVVASDPKNTKSQQLLSATSKEVTDAISSLVFAIKAGATGEIKCEEAIDSINRRIGDLDSAALFAATGQLQSESEDVDLDQLQAELDASCKKVEASLQTLVVVADKSQQDLGNAASDAMDAFEKVAKNTKIIASQLSNLLTQQDLLMGAKGVGITIQLAVTSGLNVHKSPDNAALRKALSESSSRVADTMKELLSLAQVAAAASGIKDIDNARRGIAQTLEQFDKIAPNNKSGATDVLKSAKSIADSVVTIYTSVSTGSGDDIPKLIQACDEIAKSTNNFVENSKGAIRLTDAASGKKLVDTSRAVLHSTVSFLEAAKAHKKIQNPDTLRQVSEANDELVKVIGELVEAARPLPGSEEALKLFQETDELESLAEQELVACAKTIEDAAKTLLEAKRKQLEMRKNKESPLPEEEITEAILESARAITAATGTLVTAASAAQKELMAKGKAVKTQNLYRRDPAWAKGLISAAQSVAGSVKGLMTAANNAAQGKTEEEALVASAKGVAAATARLVFASRTKADPFSETQKKLSGAAKAVASATKQLVDAARSATQQAQETDSKPDWEATNETGIKKAQIEQTTKILKLEKELKMAQETLSKMNKQEYADTTNQGTPSAAAPKPAPVRSAPTPIKKAPASSSKRVLPSEKTFTLEQLQKRPAECDPTILEQYLSDEEFVQVFNIDKAGFAKAPAWKQRDAKMKANLH